MEIFALGEGSYSVDSTKKFIPFDPQTDSAKERPGSLFIHVNPFLVKTKSDLILFDTGLGYKDTRDELFLHQHIRNAGFDPEDVTLVLMSHLHYDHSGGLVVERSGRLEPSFPDAVHVIQSGEWETAMSGKSSSYHQDIFEALRGNIKIAFVEDSANLNLESGMNIPAVTVAFTRFSGWKKMAKNIFLAAMNCRNPNNC